MVQVPEIVWNLSTKRVLTMEFCEGGQVNNKAYLVEHGISTAEVGHLSSLGLYLTFLSILRVGRLHNFYEFYQFAKANV